MSKNMNWIKISLINFVIFFLLIIVIEVGLRFIWTGYQCYKSDCNFSRITNLSIYDVLNEFLDINLGFTKYDKDLGYIPNHGFEKTTKPYAPFRLIYFEVVNDRPNARRREKFLKTTSGKRFLRSINDKYA